MRLCTLPLTASLVLLAASAGAAAPTDAEILFREGRKLATAGDWAQACPKFAESERLDPAPGTLLNLADCEEHFGTLVSSREHFALAASGFRQGEKGREVALGRVAALDARIAHLTLRLASSVPSTAVVRKGGVVVDPATLGQPVPADPGSLSVVVSLTGHVDRKYTLTIGEGANVDQELDLGEVTRPAKPETPEETRPVAPPPLPVTPLPVPPPAHTSLAGLGLLGVGAASLVVGSVTGGLALSDASVAKADCSKPNQTCSPDGHSAASSVDTLSVVSTVTFIAGGVLAAAGGYILLFGGKGSAGAGSGTALVPIVSPGAVGAILRRSF